MSNKAFADEINDIYFTRGRKRHVWREESASRGKLDEGRLLQLVGYLGADPPDIDPHSFSRFPQVVEAVTAAQKLLVDGMSIADWAKVKANVLNSRGDVLLVWLFFTIRHSDDFQMLSLALGRLNQQLGEAPAQRVIKDMDLDPRKRAFIELRRRSR